MNDDVIPSPTANDHATSATEAIPVPGRTPMSPVPDFCFLPVTSPDYRLPATCPPPASPGEGAQSAYALLEAIAAEAVHWRERLAPEYRPVVVAIVYGGIQIDVQNLSQVSFHGIRIEGTLNGAPCSLLAHQSTVQLLCYAAQVEARATHNPIGFVWGDNKVEG